MLMFRHRPRSNLTKLLPLELFSVSLFKHDASEKTLLAYHRIPAPLCSRSPLGDDELSHRSPGCTYSPPLPASYPGLRISDSQPAPAPTRRHTSGMARGGHNSRTLQSPLR